ncbi:hypothetical protein [Roseivirga misakiensis]|uniref:DUF2127 domain-containing protein n=1 Tax=Roseivirga misakiensis TaxID=1563681 RepID=A0A1E5SKW2_9BACT|nr:hypothetical protein [Roseivirga misakiensis]OEJ99741.1 hypothetical protein BFP71_09235 [Roseivirga misakiensis]
MKDLSLLFKISAILWVFWGIVHIMAGVFTINFVLSDDISGAISGIADAVDPANVQRDYPDAAGAIISQHGFNLLWIGLVTLISAFYIWKKNKNAIFLAAITGGLADLGYFLFLDLGGFVNFMPGTLMTIVSSAAITLSFYAYFKGRKATS